MFSQKKILTISVLSLALMACQPPAPELTTPVEKSSSEAVVEQPPQLRLEGHSQKLNFNLPECKGNNCPQLEVERLKSNYALVDQIIDKEITKIFSEIVERVPVQTADEKSSSEAKSLNAQMRLEQDLQGYAQAFLQLDQELKQLSANHQVNVMIKPRVLNATPPLVTVVLNSSQYLGGAHGSTGQQYYHFDLEHNKQIQLADLILPHKMHELEKKAYEAFKVWVIETNLADNIDEYEHMWKFHRTDNFYLGQQGLILQYAEYEIGPYVVGLPRFVIPYDELTHILKPAYLPVSSAKPTQKTS